MIRKVKANEVINFGQCLSSVLHSCETMPGGVQFMIDKNMKVLQPFAEEIELERRKVIEKYASKNDDGSFVTTENDNGYKEYVYKEDIDKEMAIDEINDFMSKKEYDIAIQQIPLSQYSEVKIQTKSVVNQNILFDIYIDETK